MNLEDKKTQDLINEMIDKHMCISKAEARRLVLGLPEEKIRAKLDKIKIIKINKEQQSESRN
jgi:hypothetical protein